ALRRPGTRSPGDDDDVPAEGAPPAWGDHAVPTPGQGL
ncbi:MAG: hypothetical protein AVDCRST_MAG35-957, partial [uncultured Quadrisphaera sp.]